MSPELLLMIYTITYWAGVSFAYWAGWRARGRQRPPAGSYGAPRRRDRKPLPRDQDPDWRRSFNHDNTNKKPTSPPPLLFRRRPPEVTQ